MNAAELAANAAATERVVRDLNADPELPFPDASFDAVLAGATGDFQDQFEKSIADLEESLTKSRSVQESDVLWTGVVAADSDSATVNVAASGTVTNTVTQGKADARNYRLQLELVLDDGAWLTRDLQFVGVG